MKYIFLLGFLPFMLSCQTSSKQEVSTPNAELKNLFENYYEDKLKFFPLEATSQGDNRYNDLLPNDISDDFRQKIKHFWTSNLEKTKKNRPSLPQSDRPSSL